MKRYIIKEEQIEEILYYLKRRETLKMRSLLNELEEIKGEELKN